MTGHVDLSQAAVCRFDDGLQTPTNPTFCFLIYRNSNRSSTSVVDCLLSVSIWCRHNKCKVVLQDLVASDGPAGPPTDRTTRSQYCICNGPQARVHQPLFYLRLGGLFDPFFSCLCRCSPPLYPKKPKKISYWQSPKGCGQRYLGLNSLRGMYKARLISS